jgi:hypothetical protein
MVDGYSSGDVLSAIERYRRHQVDTDTHVFVVEWGPHVNTAVTRRLSVHHEVEASPEAAFRAVFQKVLTFAREVSRDVKKLNRAQSLDKDKMIVPLVPGKGTGAKDAPPTPPKDMDAPPTEGA